MLSVRSTDSVQYRPAVREEKLPGLHQKSRCSACKTPAGPLTLLGTSKVESMARDSATRTRRRAFISASSMHAKMMK